MNPEEEVTVSSLHKKGRLINLIAAIALGCCQTAAAAAVDDHHDDDMITVTAIKITAVN